MRILIADDHAIFRDSLCFLLRSKTHYEVVAEAESIQALKQQLQSISVDLVLLDYHMPQGDALTEAEYIKRRYPAVAVIFLTGSQSGFTLKYLAESNADGVLHKEESVENILSAIDQISLGKRIVSQAITDKISQLDFHLTSREFQVLHLIIQGNTSKDIAGLIGLSYRTVDKHKEKIMSKMAVSNVVQLVAKAHSLTLFSDI